MKTAVQHERKPIVDKKEPSSASACLSITHNSTGINLNNSSTSSGGNSVGVGVMAASSVNNSHNNKFRKSYDSNTSAYLNMFPVGFNLAEFASNLEKRNNTSTNLLVNNLPIKIENNANIDNANVHLPSSLVALSSITSAVAASASFNSSSSSSSSNVRLNSYSIICINL